MTGGSNLGRGGYDWTDGVTGGEGSLCRSAGECWLTSRGMRKSGGRKEQTFAGCLIEGNRRWWYADFKEPRNLLLGTIHCCVDFENRTSSCGHGSVLLQAGEIWGGGGEREREREREATERVRANCGCGRVASGGPGEPGC